MKKSHSQLLEEATAQQQTILNNLKREVESVGLLRNKLRVEVEQEVQDLLAERKKELDILDNDSKVRLIALDEDVEAQRSTLKSLEDVSSSLEKDNYDLNKSIDTNLDVLKTLNEELLAKNSEILALNLVIEDLRESINLRSGELNTLVSDKQPLIIEIPKLKEEIEQLEARLTDLNEQYELSKAEKDAQLKELDLKVSVKAKELDQFQLDDGFVRKDLAARTLALDEREKVLTRREFKVNRDEQNIQRNAELLSM